MDSNRTQSELNGRRLNQNAPVLTPLQLSIARVISRSLFFGVILILIPQITPVFNDQGKFITFDSKYPDSITKQEFHDLIDELKTAEILTEDKESLVFIPESSYLNTDDAPNDYADYLRRMGADVVIENSFLPGGLFENEFDIVFTVGQIGARFVDRVLRSGGAVVLPATDISVNVYLDELKYRCVYLKAYRVERIIMVVMKPRASEQSDAGEKRGHRRRPNWVYHKQ
ncbi:hypothetical protein Csa_003441 [Cucumis sativus]|uniref:Uncharacterized protein n=1 Tax=Cucumis sativus TaxID=3659 RepID=A0A0A0KJZ0_CUCSA|nr:hypothetical protein Csa_003441 [Cucumis sativus]